MFLLFHHHHHHLHHHHQSQTIRFGVSIITHISSQGEKMLKKHGAPDPSVIHSFKQHWPNIQPMIKRLIHNEPIHISEWQNLFCDVHMICSWDPKGPFKLLRRLEFELRDSFLNNIKLRLKSIEDGQQQLREYSECWNDFKRHCNRFPVAFQQLDLATRDVIAHMKLPTRLCLPKFEQLSDSDATTTETTNIPINRSLAEKKNDSAVRCLLLKLWDKHVVEPLEGRLHESAKNLILDERSGHIIDSKLIINLRESFNYLDDLKLINYHSNYMQSYEISYIEAIEMFYVSRANEQFKEYGLIDYIQWALNKLEKEQQLAAQYLEPNSLAVQEAGETCTKVLIENFVEQVLIESTQYIRADDSKNIRIISRFLTKLKGDVNTKRFLDELGNHIVNTGLSYLNNSSALILNNPERFVEKLLEFYNQYAQIISSSLDDDRQAKIVLNKAFGLIVNDTRIFKSQELSNQSETNTPTKGIGLKNNLQPESRCAEMLANYCNLLLRRSTLSRKLTSDDLSEKLLEVLLIIKLVKNKEAFLRFHKYHLIRRLILDATINIEKEEEFVVNLREVAEIPMEHSNELLRMFKDLKYSENLQNQFLETLKQIYSLDPANNNDNENNNTIPTLESHVSVCLSLQDNNNQVPTNIHESIGIKVLNPSAWSRINEKISICLPNEINSIMPSFETFYKGQCKGRELEWCHQLSNGIITFSSDKGKFDLEVTAAQLAVLSTFNNQPHGYRTLKELGSMTNLNGIELKRTLWVSL